MNRIDQIIISFENTFFKPYLGNVPSPYSEKEKSMLPRKSKKIAADLMRVNHSGEVAAQALYLGQIIATDDPNTKTKLKDAAKEELEHLKWCSVRLAELEDKPSLLSPLWFLGCLSLGYFVGKFGDEYSFSFLAETESQVADHIKDHLEKLPKEDHISKKILNQMLEDEISHRDNAYKSSNKDLPQTLKNLMRFGGHCLRQLSLRI